MNYWHFVREDKKLRYADGRIVRVGRTYKVKCEPVMCAKGLHASKRLIDALAYAPGPVLCKVELGGTVLHDDDKSVATERTVIAMADVSDILRQFSREIAYESWIKYFPDDPESVVVRWLKTGDESLRSAARSAAWSAADSAARSAAWSAARSAAWSAADSAARSAAWSAAWSAQNRKLLSMIRKADWRTA